MPPPRPGCDPDLDEHDDWVESVDENVPVGDAVLRRVEENSPVEHTDEQRQGSRNVAQHPDKPMQVAKFPNIREDLIK